VEIMSLTEQKLETDEEIADKVVASTIPGSPNTGIFEGIRKAEGVLSAVQRDLNNWIDILDFRVYGENMMSVCAEYRWTIYRWGSNDMQDFMLDQGWTIEHHRLADTHLRDEDQMEARYKKKFGDVWVYINILVYFPERAFRELNGEEAVDEVKQKKMERKREIEKKQKIRQKMRE
jgi:hypothetical protein